MVNLAKRAKEIRKQKTQARTQRLISISERTDLAGEAIRKRASELEKKEKQKEIAKTNFNKKEKKPEVTTQTMQVKTPERVQQQKEVVQQTTEVYTEPLPVFSQAALMADSMSFPTRLEPRTIKQDGMVIGVEDPYLQESYQVEPVTSSYISKQARIRTAQLIIDEGRKPTQQQRTIKGSDINPLDPKSVQKAVQAGIPFKEFVETQRIVVPKEAPFREKFAARLTNIGKYVGYGVGRTTEFVKERPVLAAGTIAAFELGTAGAGKVVRFGLGVTKPVAQRLVGTTALIGFAGYKEIQEPGSVTTIPGSLETIGEFGSFALIGGAATATVKGAVALTPRYIPTFRTTLKGGQQPAKPGELPIFNEASVTRIAPETAQSKMIGKQVELFSSTATEPRTFFQQSIKVGKYKIKIPFSGEYVPRQLAADVGKAKFEVQAPAKGEVGGDRAKFNEDFFFLSAKEAYTGFGEQKVQRLGAVGRIDTAKLNKPQQAAAYLKSLTIEAPKRFKETFLRGEYQTIFRAKETVSDYPAELRARLRQGETGARIRKELAQSVAESPGKIFPGTKTGALGQGEIEFVAAQGTEFYLKSGRERYTITPEGDFAKVVDIGLKPGEQVPVEPYVLSARLRNIGEFYAKDVFGITGTPKPTKKPGKTELKGFKGRTPTIRDRPWSGRDFIKKTELPIPPRPRDRPWSGRDFIRPRSNGRDRVRPPEDIIREIPRDTRTREPRIRIPDPIIRPREPQPRIIEPRARVREPRPRTREPRTRIRVPTRRFDERFRPRELFREQQIKVPVQFKFDDYKAPKRIKIPRLKSQTRYTPSIVGVETRTRRKKKKFLTGIEIRGVEI